MLRVVGEETVVNCSYGGRGGVPEPYTTHLTETHLWSAYGIEYRL